MYNPSLLGVNCAVVSGGECISKMSNGERWQDWIDRNVIACPLELTFGTQIELDGVIYTCKDRGGAIVYDGYAYWIDILATSIPYKYGDVREALLLGE